MTSKLIVNEINIHFGENVEEIDSNYSKYEKIININEENVNKLQKIGENLFEKIDFNLILIRVRNSS